MQSIFFDENEVMIPNMLLTCAGAQRVSPETFLTPYGFVWSAHSTFATMLGGLKTAPSISEDPEYLERLFKAHIGCTGIIISSAKTWVEEFYIFGGRMQRQGHFLSLVSGVKSKMQCARTEVTDAYNAVYGDQDLAVMLKAVKEQTTFAHCSYTSLTKADAAAALSTVDIRSTPF